MRLFTLSFYFKSYCISKPIPPVPPAHYGRFAGENKFGSNSYYQIKRTWQNFFLSKELYIMYISLDDKGGIDNILETIYVHALGRQNELYF